MRTLIASVVLFLAACSPGPYDVCKRACERAGECLGSTQGQILDCKTQCDRDLQGNKDCTNLGSISTCFDGCNQKSNCNEFGACTTGCPRCVR